MPKRVATIALREGLEHLAGLHLDRTRVLGLYQFLIAAAHREAAGDAAATLTFESCKSRCNDWFGVSGQDGSNIYTPVGRTHGWQGETANGGWSINTLWKTLDDGKGARPKVFSSVISVGTNARTVHFREPEQKLVGGLRDLLSQPVGKKRVGLKIDLDSLVAWRNRYRSLEDSMTLERLRHELAKELNLTPAEQLAVFSTRAVDLVEPTFFDAEEPNESRLLQILGPTPDPAGELTQVSPSTGVISANRQAVAHVELDPRLWRMIRVAIATFPAVILVGPPGTGKGQILAEVARKVAQYPEAFGFAREAHGPGWPRPVVRTPHENWSTFDLVGGYVGGAKGLRWAPGFLLDAIRDDQWVVLDEANRADLDKIMGPLITWLAGQSAELGTTTLQEDRKKIVLGWTDEHGCETAPPEGVDGAAGPASGGVGEHLGEKDMLNVGAAFDDVQHQLDSDDVTYSAGRDWRLLGSYNPVDAQLVFPMGQALGRRLKAIPIAPLDVTAFGRLLSKQFPSLHSTASQAIQTLYRAHNDHESRASLGPALFLDIAAYILSATTAGMAGAETPNPGGSEPEIANPESTASTGAVQMNIEDAGDEFNDTDTAGEAVDAGGLTLPISTVPILSLVADGYLISVGRYAASLERSQLEIIRSKGSYDNNLCCHGGLIV